MWQKHPSTFLFWLFKCDNVYLWQSRSPIFALPCLRKDRFQCNTQGSSQFTGFKFWLADDWQTRAEKLQPKHEERNRAELSVVWPCTDGREGALPPWESCQELGFLSRNVVWHLQSQREGRKYWLDTHDSCFHAVLYWKGKSGHIIQ